MGPARVLMCDPCPSGLQDMPGAHVGIAFKWLYSTGHYVLVQIALFVTL